MANTLKLIQCRSTEILTHTGPEKLRHFLVVINNVAVDVISDRAACTDYYTGDSLDRYIALQLEVYEAALGCKAERHFFDYPVMDARNEFYNAFRKNAEIYPRVNPAPV